MSDRTPMPSIFLGHGNPMNALSVNEWTRAWKGLGHLPLIYVLAQHQPEEPVAFPVEGFDGGSISMLGVEIG